MEPAFVSSAIIVSLAWLCVKGQYVQSPCPEVFDYKSDGAGVYGLIRLNLNAPTSVVVVKTNFTVAARLPSQYMGRLEPIGNPLTLLQELKRGAPLSYRLQFPVSSPLPRITSITANDNLLCYGTPDVPGPQQYVTIITLQHTLYLKGGGGFQGAITPGLIQTSQSGQSGQSGVIYTQFQSPGQNSVVEYPGDRDGQVYTISFDTTDRNNGWNSDSYDTNSQPIQPPRPIVTLPPQPLRPITRPVVTRPIQTPAPVPDYSYYPEEPVRPVPQPRPQQRPQEPAPIPQIPVTPSRLPAPSPGPIKCGTIANGDVPLIYNGKTYPRGDWPWLVAIYKKKEGGLTFKCAGTLVSERHVVTAAHCMRQKYTVTQSREIVVKIGVYNLEDWSDDIFVTRTLASATLHESYNPATLANDILVLTFDRSVEFNANIRPACLWDGNTDLSRIVGASGVVAGWGKSEVSAPGLGEPRMVRIPIVSTQTCRASNPDFHKLTSPNTMCAGDRNGDGPCLGDSGGGLYLLEDGRWKLRGVVSVSLRSQTGESTCNLNEYIVFTDSAKYLDWIKRTIRDS